METQNQQVRTPFKLLANNKVIGYNCTTCGKGFKLAEEVYSCPVCSGHHHLSCWESNPCRETADSEPVEQPTSLPEADEEEALILGACPSCGRLHMVPVQRCPCGYNVRPRPALADPTPAAVEVSGEERSCPECGKTIRSEALKCRFCGHVFDRLSEKYEPATIPTAVKMQFESDARNALKYGIIGLFICTPVLAPMAISSGNSALRSVERYPENAAALSARTKARVGVVCGWVGLALFALFILGKFGQM